MFHLIQTLRLRFVGRIVEFADVWRFQNVRRCWPRVGIHVQHSPNAICSFRRDVAAPSDILQEVREQTAVVRVQEQPALVSASARQKPMLVTTFFFFIFFFSRGRVENVLKNYLWYTTMNDLLAIGVQV